MNSQNGLSAGLDSSKAALVGLWVFLTCVLPALIKKRGVSILFLFCHFLLLPMLENKVSGVH
jgi:hypothetical protein